MRQSSDRPTDDFTCASSLTEDLAFVHAHTPALDGLMEKLCAWSDCNSGSRNLAGLERMAAILQREVSRLTDDVQLLETPPATDFDPRTGDVLHIPLGRALLARKRPEANLRILLNGHMDTVFSPDSPFQICTPSLDGRYLHGPGVADMKGGLLVMLEALAVFEQHPMANRIGWDVLITADEEIGSPGSDAFLREAAGRNHIGLIYESSPPGGALARSRMGGGNFLLRAHGRSVHVGKNFADGRNAIDAIAEAVLAVRECNTRFPEARFNVGHIAGGETLNAVAAFAHARFNIRFTREADRAPILARLEEIRSEVAARHGVQLVWHGGLTRPPKHPDAATEALYQFIRRAGMELGMDLTWQDSGGGTDGSNLLAHGLPNIDTLGVIGMGLHTDEERMETGSLIDRIGLTALLLVHLARRGLPPEIRIPRSP